MEFSLARSVAARLEWLSHRASVGLAYRQLFIEQDALRQRRLFRLQALAGFGLVALCSQAYGQISLVNVTGCGPASFPGSVCTIPATGAGHLIVVGLQAGSGTNTGTTISSITDNANNSYVEAANARSIDAAEGSVADFWYAKNTTAGGTTITINPSASLRNAGVVVWEFAGADPNAPLDQAKALNSQSSSGTPLGAAVTTGAANEVVVAMAAVAGQVTGIYSGNPFSNDSSTNGQAWSHLITTSAGTFTPEWVQNPAGTYSAGSVSFVAAASGSGVDPCDLNNDGAVNVLDANLAVSMSLGQTPCTANIDGPNVCNVVIVQRVVNAANGGSCVTGNSHTVALNWVASTSPNIAGYNVFRGAASGGPYTQLNTSLLPALTYSDTNVQPAQTYYYVTNAVDINSNISVYSNEATTTVPTP